MPTKAARAFCLFHSGHFPWRCLTGVPQEDPSLVQFHHRGTKAACAWRPPPTAPSAEAGGASSAAGTPGSAVGLRLCRARGP